MSEKRSRIGGGSATLTMEDAVKIVVLIHSGELQSRIAAKFDINGGRVSEINTGKRFPGAWKIAADRGLI